MLMLLEPMQKQSKLVTAAWLRVTSSRWRNLAAPEGKENDDGKKRFVGIAVAAALAVSALGVGTASLCPRRPS